MVSTQADSHSPTPYLELNAVLSHLVEGAKAALKENLIGAYLQGSFAVGDHSAYSDCDFIIVVDQDLAFGELQALQRLHKEIHSLPYPYWRRGLEGSYTPAAILRRWSTNPRDPPGEPRPDDWADPGTCGTPPRAYPFWYLDHGSDTLARSEHDNTQVVRWCLREKRLVLTGPDPRQLIDPVAPTALRAEVRETMDRCLSTGLPMPMIAWQAFWVALYCRMLHTLATGEVTSKKQAMDWALKILDPQWHGLIARTKMLKKGDEACSCLPVDPIEAEATYKFAAYSIAFADQSELCLGLSTADDRPV